MADLLEGVSITLKDTGTITLTVGTDKDSIIEKVEEFREAYNGVRTAIKEATAYDASTGEAATLVGNYALQIIKARLDGLVSTTAPGFQDPDDCYVNLQQLGFSTDAVQGSETEGLLLLDTSVLSSALDQDPEAVVRVFSAYLSGITDSTTILFSSSLSTATAGIYDVGVDTDNEKGRFRLEGGDWGDWIDLGGSSGAYTLTCVEGPERGISLSISLSSGTGTHSAELRLRNGILTELGLELEDLLGSSGPLANLEESYTDIVENIEGRIEQEETRLDAYEERLIERFARLDAYISSMNSLGSYLTLYTQQTGD